MNALRDTLKAYEEQIGQELSRLYPDPGQVRQSVLYEAMAYSLTAGGKRLRPVLLLECCKMVGGDAEKAMPLALAIEMIHSYSLIHDDLPCMDDDDFRRGKPSCHKQFGEANALLAGDALLTGAFEQIGKATALSPEIRSRAVFLLAQAAGAAGMVGGQTIDLEIEGKRVDAQTLIGMYGLKTGALLKAACQLGVLAGGGSEEQIDRIGRYASAMGLAFQIIDDILDVVGDASVLGKPIGSDEKSDKTTFVTLFGLEGARQEAARYTEQAMDELQKFENHQFLSELTTSLLKRNY